MKPTEAAALLTICAAYDNRKPDADQAKAWSLALDGYGFEECRDAIAAHYRNSREWIMPSDVITAVRRERTSRIEDAPPIPIPEGFDPDDTAAYQELLRESRRAQAEGRDVVVPPYRATRRIGELRGVLKALPKSDGTLRPGKTAEHQAALEAARAELDAVRAAIPALREIAEQETETDHEEGA